MSKSIHETAVADLSSLAVIEVTGDEAQEFLQGQFSNDVAAVTDDSPAQLSAYCNPKGRALAVLRLLRYAAGYWLIVPADVAAGLAKRLSMYVLRAKVKVALRAEIRLLGLVNGDDIAIADNIKRVAVAGVVPRQILVADRTNFGRLRAR